MNEHHLTVSRTARYYTLGDPGGARHIWFACHGYGQLAAQFLGYLASSSAKDRLFVAPEALSRFYHDQGRGPIGASWMTREDRDNEIGDYVGYLDQLYQTILTGVPAGARSYLLGFSQGVATATRWLTLGQASFAGFTLWAGTVPQEVSPEQLSPRVHGSRVAVVAGDSDSYLPGGWLTTERARFAGLGADSRAYGFHGGHRLDRNVLATMLEEMERDPA